MALEVIYLVILDYTFSNDPARFLKASCLERSHEEEVSFTESYAEKYPFLLECKNPYQSWTQGIFQTPNFNYTREAPEILHETRITRAVLVYFPLNMMLHFKNEFKWLYRSWINMIEHEPPKWRTDLIVFIEHNENATKKDSFFFRDLGCSFENLRTSVAKDPLCTLIGYEPINKRKILEIENFDKDQLKAEFYLRLFNDANAFDDNDRNLDDFYYLIQQSLSKYAYTDSILMAFDGYEYFKQAGYDFLVRTDMDVFLTPLFAKWLPRNCDDFYVGRGGYLSRFNSKRFKRIATNLGLAYADSRNLGSTWYSTPNQFRLVSYLTLLGMAYLNNEEFSQPERESKVGTILWPDWHYGVLLLYGQHLALNHLIGSNIINVVKLENQLDYPSGNNESIYKMLHIHVYHGENLFSKGMFRYGRYDNMSAELGDEEREKMVAYFCLKMALEGKFLKGSQFIQKYFEAISKKI